MRLTDKKKNWLIVLGLIAVPLLIFVIHVQLNQPESMTGDYIRLWKSTWHEKNKEWLYPMKFICLGILGLLAGSGLMIALSKSERWK
ncbi:hypothetical protein ACVRXQ_05260 [Streptococcus panodentis]|uniref:Uncharacterized protein n=1 Tax=Streptococcus panodentis TaxID=1581472 RepID=A0ABS5AZS0_9STRE|nr:MULTISPECIES: hypothetical protein [Streptococcus]KXT84454.1 hypothetical protein STRDD11_00954 [Streptococcus sp. DD11]MBP2621921.1 hypothetical protein [Streptococcus panodentis]